MTARRWRHLGAAACLAAAALLGAPTSGQDAGTIQSEILVLDPDRLFAETLVGQRLTDQYQAERDALIANNRELEAELRAEEQALTDARKTMTPQAFRAKADAFDEKVRSIRAENDRKARDLERGRELAPFTLMRMAEPILVQLMRDTGGKIILDNRQVLLRADVIDITSVAVARIDAQIGDGSGMEPQADEEDAEQQAPEETPQDAAEEPAMPQPDEITPGAAQ